MKWNIKNTIPGKCTVLVSLSAAFVLLNRLQYLYGIPGTAFKWFQSYIEQRNNQVCVGDSLSQMRPVASAVPQGSVLGDRLFTMYTYPLALIFNKHKVEYHSYADNNNNNCLKSNIQWVQWTINVGSSHMRVHAVTPKLVICVMYFNVNLTDSFDDRQSQCRLIEWSCCPHRH